MRRLTQINAREVARNLSKGAKELLVTMFDTSQKLTIRLEPHHLAEIFELFAKKIIRADINLLDGKYIVVLERGGKYVFDILKEGK